MLTREEGWHLVVYTYVEPDRERVELESSMNHVPSCKGSTRLRGGDAPLATSSPLPCIFYKQAIPHTRVGVEGICLIDQSDHSPSQYYMLACLHHHYSHPTSMYPSLR
jgi:hypothetical protein